LNCHSQSMQTHHAKNLQTMSPESWILPEEMLYFLFLRSWTENLSVMRKLNPLVQNEGWKKKKFLTKTKWEYYYYLLVSNVEDAKCQPSQGCYNPSHNNDIVHQQKNIHKTISHSLSTFFATKIAKFKLPIFWILNPNLNLNLKLDQAAAIGIPQASMMTLAGIHFCCTNVMMEEWYFVCKSSVMFLIMSKFCLIILWS
jgi:hypothetical protein